MGLDMYLCKQTGAKKVDIAYWRKANSIHGFFNKQCANGNLENCQEVLVSKETIEELLDRCRKVLDIFGKANKVKKRIEDGYTIRDGKKIPSYMDFEIFDNISAQKICAILPPCKGFFFGQYEIDDNYKYDIIHTRNVCIDVLKKTQWDTEKILYMAWW